MFAGLLDTAGTDGSPTRIQRQTTLSRAKLVFVVGNKTLGLGDDFISIPSAVQSQNKHYVSNLRKGSLSAVLENL